MSALNEPIEVTVDKGGNVIIFIDRHNLSATAVLDMAARAMLAAGYEKEQLVEAALAYADKHGVQKSATEPAATIAPPPIPPAAPTKPEEVPAAVTPALPVVDEKPEPAPAVTPLPEIVEAPVSVAPVFEAAKAPVIIEMAVKSEPVPVTAGTPPPFEVPPLAKAEDFPARVPQAPVSVMGNSAEMPAASAPAADKPSQSSMDETLAADRKRIQALIASAGGKAHASTPVDAPVHAAAPVMPVETKPEFQETAQIAEMAAAQGDWQGQKFDPNTSTSMLIPPMPGLSDGENPEMAAVADVPLSPPPLPKKPVTVVTPAMMARPITTEVEPAPAKNIPPPPAGGPVSLLSRITGFVKLNTIAIPSYPPSEAGETTINTPRPVTPSVLSPQSPPAPPAKR